MRVDREEFSAEQAAVQRDAARGRASGHRAGPSAFSYDFGRRGYGVLTAREARALPWGLDAAAGHGGAGLVQRDLGSLNRVFNIFGEQRREIARLREDTRRALAALSHA